MVYHIWKPEPDRWVLIDQHGALFDASCRSPKGAGPLRLASIQGSSAAAKGKWEEIEQVVSTFEDLRSISDLYSNPNTVKV